MTARVWNSLRWRLPFLMAVVIIVVVGVFLMLAFRQVQADLTASAGVRARAAADQLASLLAFSTQQRLVEIRAVATDKSVCDYVTHPTDDLKRLAEARLSSLSSPSPEVLELWNRSQQRVLSVALPATASNVVPADAPAPTASAVSPLQIYRGGLFTQVAMDIASGANGCDPQAGYLVVRRPAVVSGTAETLNRLVGDGASVKIGNRVGDGWTDLSSLIPPPPVERAESGVATYSAADGQERLGTFAPIAATPWVVWVDFSLSSVRAPAFLFLRRMIAIALVVVVLASGLVYLMSARITTPLAELTQASEAMAHGQYSARVAYTRSDEIGRLGVVFNAMSAQVERQHEELEDRVRQRTLKLEEAGRVLSERVEELKKSREELMAANQELEAFSYSVSHDLRAPLRHVSGFATLLKETKSESLDADGHRLLKKIMDAGNRMGALIDDLLSFSRIGRTALSHSTVSLNDLVHAAQDEVNLGVNGHDIIWRVDELPSVKGDRALLRLVLVNLLSNAAKYSAGRSPAEIEVGTLPTDADETVLFVRDNGVGFDMQYAHKLFGVFQRLHSVSEFEGTGIGLANVKRIVTRHGGRVWAEGAVDAGATFYVALPGVSGPR